MKKTIAVTALLLAVFMGAGRAEAQEDALDGALRGTAAYLTETLEQGTKLVILNFKSDHSGLSEYVIDTLTENLVKARWFTVLDRANLALIEQEMQLHLSGEVDDSSAVSLGHKIGAQTIVSGSLSVLGSLWRFSVRALDVETAEVRGIFNQNITGSALIAALTGGKVPPRPAAPVSRTTAPAAVPAADTAASTAANATANAVASAAALLEKGKAAQAEGKTIEALSYFIQARSLDPSLAEAAKLASDAGVNINTGSVGADARSAVAWRRSWVERITECDQYVAKYVRTNPLAAALVYSTEALTGEIDWVKETLPLTIDLCLVPDANWPAPVTGVVDAVYEGLAATGQAQTWKLEWPETSASGGASQVKPTVNAKYTLGLELLNEEGVPLGRQNVELSAGWRVGFVNGKAEADKMQIPKTITFPALEVSKLSDHMTLRIVSVNGRPGDAGIGGTTVTVQPLAQADYTTTAFYSIKIGDEGPAGGIVFYDKGSYSDGWRYLECAPASTEMTAEMGVPDEKVNGTRAAVGSGRQNTWILLNYLLSKGQSGKAAQLCAGLNYGGYDDWFLPSNDELNLMYTVLHKNGLGSFKTDGWYWSSTQGSWGIITQYVAKVQHFSNGEQSNSLNYMNNTYNVRAIRAF